MTGQPVLHKLIRYVEAKGGDEWLLNRLADGESVGAIAKSIDLPGHGSISRPMLYNWRNKGGEPRREGWRLALKASGHALAEDAGEALNELRGTGATAAEVSLARSRSEYLRWLAGKRNERYGEKATVVDLTLNVADLHLDALRRHGHMGRPQVVEADVVELLEAGE